jgi:hypothetical protein
MGLRCRVEWGLSGLACLACSGDVHPVASPVPADGPPGASAAQPVVEEPLGVAPNAIVLDSLFAGIERGCARSEVLQATLDSLATWDGQVWVPRERVVVSEDVAAAFGKPRRVSTEASHSVVSIPVSGAVFRGLPVTEVVRWMGHENGIHGFAISLDVDQPRADRILRAALNIVDSCSGDPQCPVEPVELTIVDKAGRARLVCDLST